MSLADLENAFKDALRRAVAKSFQSAVADVAVSHPPSPDQGDLATPLCFVLARAARTSPKAIAAALVAACEPVPGLRRVEVERHPAFLRVYLVSERSERVGTRSYVRVVNGDFKSAAFAVLFQHG